MKKRSTWIIVGISAAIVLFLSLILVSMYMLVSGEQVVGGNIAYIPIKGMITTDASTDFFSSGVASSTKIIERIEKAENNPSVKGVIFEINSGGGGAVASSEIVQAIKNMEKPSVAWIREAGASGAYWAASACDGIVANELSVTGSIGVISSYLEFSGLMDDYNVTYQRLVAGDKKDIGTPLKELTPEERQILEEKLDKAHAVFLDDVVKSRELTSDQKDEVSSGLFYFGLESQELGLVDMIGGEEQAVDMIKNLTGLDSVNKVEYRDPPTFFDTMAMNIFKKPSTHMNYRLYLN